MPPYYPCWSQERARATTPASPTNYYLYGAVLLNSSIMVAMRDPLQLRVAVCMFRVAVQRAIALTLHLFSPLPERTP